MKHLSIRKRLGLQALVIGAVMLCLALSFVWAERQSDRAFVRIESEISSAAELRNMESRLGMIHEQTQAILNGQRSSSAALEVIRQERDRLGENWDRFLKLHSNWLHDPEEDRLVAEIGAGLPTLGASLDAIEQAYAGDELAVGASLSAHTGALHQKLIQSLNAQTALQDRHVLAATNELESGIRKTRVIVFILLGSGMLAVALLSIRLGRHIIRRIEGIERALEAMARGDQTVQVPYHAGETEMVRIASAINRTVSQIGQDRSTLAELTRQLGTILSSAAEGIYGVDRDGLIMFINPAALQGLGYEEHEVIGRGAHALLHHHDRDGNLYPIADCPVANSRLTGRVGHRDDEVFFRKDGSSFPVEYTSAPLLDGDRTLGAVVIFHDITERRDHELLLKRTVTQLRETNARLGETQMQLIQAEKLAGLGQLAAGVAHEMNNPVSFVSANFATLEMYVRELLQLTVDYEELLARISNPEIASAVSALHERVELDFLREDIQALISESRDGLQRVTRIVADLKDFSRTDAVQGDWGEVDVNHCLDATCKVVANSLQEKAELVREYERVAFVKGNALQLNQIFLNLLLNAIHAISGHGTITLRTSQRNGEVCVEIADTGCGMSAEVVGRMFDPFYTTRPVGQGQGLGLAVAYSIAKQHGGRFEVDSVLDKGTAVRLWLPALVTTAEVQTRQNPLVDGSEDVGDLSENRARGASTAS